jgi:hypothetical protein
LAWAILVNEGEDALFRPAGVTPARVANPLAEDAALLRSTGLVSMAHALAWNLNRGQHNLHLFEIGRAYRLQNDGPQEIRIVTIGATGLAREKGVAEDAREYGFADLKGDLDQIGALAGDLCGRRLKEAGGIPHRRAISRRVRMELARRPRGAMRGSLPGALPKNSSCGRTFFLPNGLSIRFMKAIVWLAKRGNIGRFRASPRWSAISL